MNSLYSANALPVDNGNRLRFSLINALSGTALTVTARWSILRPNGDLSENAESFIVQPDAGQQDFTFKLTKGLLVAATLSGSAVGLQNGILYGVMALQYGDVASETQLLRLMSGYILNNAPLNYPLGDVVAVNSGIGATVVHDVSDPGAGADYAVILPTDSRSQLYSGSFVLSTDATVADRTINLTVSDASGVIFITQAKPVIQANSVITIVLWKAPISTNVPDNVRFISIPEHPPLQGLNFTTNTTNLQLADEFRAMTLRPIVYAAN